MKKVSQHTVDPELVEEGVYGERELLESGIQSAAKRAAALSSVLSKTRSYAGYLAVAQPKSEEICRALRIGARAAASIFALATGNGEVEVDLGEMRTKLPATGSTDSTHVGNWRIGWWLAHIVRDHSAIAQLVSTPIDVLRQSSTRGDECQYLFIDALQAFEKRADDWSTRLRMALDATDPEQVNISDEEFVLNILVPEMQLLFRLAIGEIAPFNEALQFALERHKKYWGKGNRKRDPDGYLALGPLAIVAIAHNAGMPIEVESEYLPRRLFEGDCREQ
jgi:Immunity protein 49